MQTPKSSTQGKQLSLQGLPTAVQLPGSAAGRGWQQEHVDVTCHRAVTRSGSFLVSLYPHTKNSLVSASISLPFTLQCHLSVMTTFKWCQVQSLELYLGWVTCPTNSLCCTVFHGCLCALPQVHDFLWHWKFYPAVGALLPLLHCSCLPLNATCPTFIAADSHGAAPQEPKEHAYLYQDATDTGILLQTGLTFFLFFSNTFCKLKNNNMFIF